MHVAWQDHWVTGFDWVIVSLLLGAVVLGSSLGLLRSVLSLIGLAVGVVVAFSTTRQLMLRQAPEATTARNWIFVGGFLGLPIIGWCLGGSVARLARGGNNGLSPGERFLGAIVSGAAMSVVVWLVVPASSTSTLLESWSRRSETSHLLRNFPTPPVDLGALIASDSFPAHLSQPLGVEEISHPPVDLPSVEPAVLAAAENASVQVIVRKCGKFAYGSGFAVGPHLIATNAHVVAGTASPVRIIAGDQSADGDVVLFDPGEDFALISVPPLDLPVLTLDPGPVVPHAIVITLGHPNGQDSLDVGPARLVDQKFLADTDPYGKPVYRSTLLLSTAGHVYPGSSGSPVIDQEGSFIGIIYAGPKEGTGFALAISGAELQADLAKPILGPVSAGSCSGLEA